MAGNVDLKELRNNLVAKDNRLIQKSRSALSLVENKAVLYLISKIQPNDKPGKIYKFNCREFQALCNWNSADSYQYMKVMLQNLGDVSMWIDMEIDGRTKDVLLRWFDIVRMDPGTGDIDISFQTDMLPFLLDLQKHLEEDGQHYTAYKLQNVSLMKHRYSSRIYELLRSYQFNNKKWTFENGTGSEYDIQMKIADTVTDKKTRKPVAQIPESWSNWAIFRRDVLEPAIKEINKYTDIKVAYEGKKEDIHHRKTRAIRTIEFYMAEKTTPEQRSTNEIIDAEYSIIEDEINYHQMTIEEMFFLEHEKSLEIEKQEKEMMHQEEMDKELEKAKHPILTELLNVGRGANLDERKVDQLYSTAIYARVAGRVEFKNWEDFATDIILYYYDKIAATPEKTKTSLYQRLLDCVKNDYDNEVEKALARYEYKR